MSTCPHWTLLLKWFPGCADISWEESMSCVHKTLGLFTNTTNKNIYIVFGENVSCVMSRIELISSMGSVKTFRKLGTVGLSELLYCFHCISEASPRTKSYRLSWGLRGTCWYHAQPLWIRTLLHGNNRGKATQKLNKKHLGAEQWSTSHSLVRSGETSGSYSTMKSEMAKALTCDWVLSVYSRAGSL